MTHLRALAVGVALAIAATGCATGFDPTEAQPEDGFTLAVPPTLGGLNVKFSGKATSRVMNEVEGSSAYVRDASVFELRSGEELRAVFQVLRMTPDARTDEVEFRRQVAQQISGSSRAPENVGGIAVFKASRNQQAIHTWFDGKFMQVLIVREIVPAGGLPLDVERLLLEALALEPVPQDALTST